MSLPDANSDLKNDQTIQDTPMFDASTFQPSTPPRIKKFRARTAFETSRKHPGKANDPDVASELVHGKITTSSPSIHSVLNPPQMSLVQEKIQELNETVYRSSQRAPLGRSRNQPNTNDNTVHGIKTEKGVGARETIYPLQPWGDLQTQYHAGRRGSVRSRNSIFVGEQINRNYNPHHFNRDLTFGIRTPHHNDGRGVGNSLCWVEKPE
ncbi:EF-hand domain-containing family member B-like [Cynoglossus semilaevis]|uniref:EF-hand domain-containing family member B-like n=1 Tax=Cynoglossus semilaevis TaxID=244447 RepID=UPI0004963CF9|nr:EF-hand domain-containing family member B-like [Cynoglossus semilaevis]